MKKLTAFNYRFVLTTCVLIVIVGLSILSAQSGAKIPTRAEVEEQYTWNLTSLFQSDQQWEETFNQMEQEIGEFANYDGKLVKSGKNLLACLKLRDQVRLRIEQLYSYAARKRDQDLNNTTYQAMDQKIRALWTKFSQATAFINPEILTISDRKLQSFLKREKDLQLYEFYLEDVTRVKAHILSKEEEELLSLIGEVTPGASLAFGMLTNADFKWGTILDEEQEEVEMSRSRYYLYMDSPDRRVRQDAYMELYVPYEGHQNTITSLITTRLKTDVFYMKARKYDTSLEAALDEPNIPVEVYHNLINTLNENLEPLHRWAALKKRVLGVDELHPYDTYAPLFPEVQKTYTYEEAQKLIKYALEPLGEEVQTIINKAFAERWIDVYENVGKRGGAYSSGVYGVHPYILMNFNGTLSSVMTLAHELGHTIHSYLSNSNQPYIYSGYAIFNAEVASTTNEALLMDYLMANTESKAEKLALLQEYVQDIGSTFYRQGRFAEFELRVHEKVERDEPLTHESISEIFGDLYQKYWGSEMVVDDVEKLSWSRIPHFYYNYYVYSYATSFAASQLMAQNIKNEGQPAIEAYLKFLSSGGSDYPIELLKLAGVDMSTAAPIEATTAKMDQLLTQMEAIIATD